MSAPKEHDCGPHVSALLLAPPMGEREILQKENRLDSIPLGFLRGLNWNAKCIVADEAQNMTVKEITTLITRVGEFSKVFILGDPDQSDINGKSGFMKINQSIKQPLFKHKHQLVQEIQGVLYLVSLEKLSVLILGVKMVKI